MESCTHRHSSNDECGLRKEVPGEVIIPKAFRSHRESPLHGYAGQARIMRLLCGESFGKRSSRCLRFRNGVNT